MKIIIIGNGIAGVTAARNIRKQSADAEIFLVSKESKFFFSRTALMYVFMGHMKFEHTQPYEDNFWSKNRITLIEDEVLNIDYETKSVDFKKSENLIFDKLILATGSKPNQISIEGADLAGIQGFYSKQDLDKLEKASVLTKNAVIIGGGLIGIEVAEMLVSRGIKVDFIVRESSFWNNVLPEEESKMISENIVEHGVNLRLETELATIEGYEGSLKSIKTKADETIECTLLCTTIGVQPNIEFLKNTALDVNRGILVDKYLETNIQNVFAVGDCVEHQSPPENRRAIEQIWYSGRMMGEVVAANVLGKKIAYKPGVFFNSAKFFNIEYQTYGTVLPTLDNKTKTFFWKHESKNILIRLNYLADNEHFIGMNVFGIRMKHEVVVDWISTKKTIQYVVEHLEKANFDPEFFETYQNQMVSKFNTENNTQILAVSNKSWFQKLFQS